ncbi:transmembrane protein 60 [Contarinia nasturtii]|uniref:transmembrane protein 60 n=1 Tax=Contarinia nasturtii TaxID=265458 RepID=UPI0012D4A7CC|nr:transmembrane protein 60 [Contarinia nasturtii]
MTLVHRALFTWFIILVFCICLCLRLENRTQWNYFIVFIPLWIFDAILLIYVIIKIVSNYRYLEPLKKLIQTYQWTVAVILLKIAAEICICLKIEYAQLNLSIYTVMIPIWILLPSTIVYVFINLVKHE